MAIEDEDRPTAQTAKNLDEMSIADLEAYIDDLEREIQRARATIAFKQESCGSAAALFNLK